MDAFHLGCDEAGKGPVLGPMVAAAVRVSADPGGDSGVDPATLPAGVADSKRLTADRRESLAAALRAADGVAVGRGVVGVDEIDAPDTDMNGLTVAAHVRAIAGVAVDGDRVLVDAGDVSESRFARRVAGGLADRRLAVEVSAEHRADEANPLVGAASVLAKVERDRRVAALDEKYGDYGSLGSGYPGDPATRAFLAAYVERHGEVPDCARRSWSTCGDVLAAAEQSSLAEF